MSHNINVVLSLQDRFTSKMTTASYEVLKFKRNLEAAKLASSKMKDVMNTMERWAVGTAAAVGAASAAFAKSSLDAFGEFESKMNEVAGIKGISTASEEFYKLEDAAKASAKAVKGSTYNDAADSLKYLALAGWDTNESITALPATLKAIRINGTDVKETADALTDSMTALGLSAEQAGEYVDFATIVQGNSNTNMLQLNNALIKSGAGFESLYTRAETAAEKMEIAKEAMTAIGALGSVGMKDTQAGTVLNSVLTRMSKETGETEAGLKQIGLTLYDNTGKFKDLGVIFTEMKEAVSGLSEQERNKALSLIGGRYRSQLVSIMDAYTKADEKGKTFYENMKEAMELGEGAADRYIEAVTSGYSGQVGMLAAQWQNFKIDTGEMLAPYATEALEYLTDKMPSIQEWLENKLPSALETGKGILLEIKDILKWCVDNYETIGLALGGAYLGMGAFRAGTGMMEAYATFTHIKKGINAEKAAKANLLINDIKQADKLRYNAAKGALSGKYDISSIDVKDKSFPLLLNFKNTPKTAADKAFELSGDFFTGAAPMGASEIPDKALKEQTMTLFSAPVLEEITKEDAAMGAALIGNGAVVAGNGAELGAVLSGTGGTSAATMAGFGGFAATVASVAAIALGLTAAYKNSEKLRESVKKFGKSFTPIAEGAKKGLEKMEAPAKRVKEALKDLAKGAGDVISPVVNGISWVTGKLSEGVGRAAETLPVAVNGFFGFMDEFIFGDEWNSGMDTLKQKWDDVTEAVQKYLNKSALFGQMEESVNKNKLAIDLLKDKFGGLNSVLDKIIDNIDYIYTGKWGEDIYDTKKDLNNQISAGAFSFSNVTAKERVGMIKSGKIGEFFYDVTHQNHNALGTSYWKGGATYINENGGEIAELPTGTKIIPADRSREMAKGEKVINVNVNVENLYGEDREFINRIGNDIAHRLALLM